MTKYQQNKLNVLYEKHLNALRRQGRAASTIDVYARAVRRIAEYFDRCPDKLTQEQLKDYFSDLVKSHSWSTVKVDRIGLQFFYKHVLGKDWRWVDIVKPPQKIVLPDIFSIAEIERLINGARELRYQTFILVTFSMGLRLGEALNLKIGDIDAGQRRVHVRQGKGRKDRYVFLPARALQALRGYWITHRNPSLLFPGGKTPALRAGATRVMNRGGLQKSFKAIVGDCGLHKSVSIHTLRHSYGANLVEASLNLRAIQHEMGHDSPKTTALYTQLTEAAHQNAGKVIDRLVESLQITLDGEVEA